MEGSAKSAQVEKQGQGQVTGWMERLEDSIKRANEICQHINASLIPLLRDEPPPNEKNKAEVEEQLVPLANQIRGYVEQINRISEQYQGMITLFEL